jgi:purine-binding chemotaxis protein CheW
MLATLEHPGSASSPTVAAREFLTFRLGAAEYAIDILTVQEIRGYDAVTAIANAPAFIRGVINLRGIIVPIVDLRLKFNIGEARYDALTVVIILNIARRVVGVVVDGVSDVLMLGENDIKPAPEFASEVNTRFIQGLGTVDDRMLIVVDIEALMMSADMGLADGPGA